MSRMYFAAAMFFSAWVVGWSGLAAESNKPAVQVAPTQTSPGQIATPPGPGTHPLPAQPLLEAQRTFASKTVTTSEVSMTGMRFNPVSVNTAEVVMTGLRFVPVVVETAELSMTGMR